MKYVISMMIVGMILSASVEAGQNRKAKKLSIKEAKAQCIQEDSTLSGSALKDCIKHKRQKR